MAVLRLALVMDRIHDVDLPTELWQEILSFCTSPEIAALALVSQRFRAISRPLLFRSCTFRMRRHDKNRNCHQRLRLRLDFLTSPEIAPLLQDCVIQGCRRSKPEWIATICANLPLFPSLRRLDIRYLSISSATVSALSNLTCQSSLLSLSLVRCGAGIALPSGWEKHQGSISVESFTSRQYESAQGVDRWRFDLTSLNIAALRHLDLGSRDSTKWLVMGFSPRTGTRFPNVETLHLHVRGLDDVPESNLISTLACFPSVRTLDIRAPHNYDRSRQAMHGPIGLPMDHLPALQSFHGPARQVVSYCRGRPSVRHLKLYGLRVSQTCKVAELSPLLFGMGSTSTCAQIVSIDLRIAMFVETITSHMARIFPSLRALRMVVPRTGVPGVVYDFQRILDSMEALILSPALEVLFLAFRYDVDVNPWAHPNTSRFAKMEEAVRQLASRFPALEHICVCCDLGARAAGKRTRMWRWSRGLREEMVWAR
ncbi:hypothetical protein FB45DRAFT_1036625 [Roridomyces roridus]|uniref:F-box domain-containing protein n=1 Tax=Roridomyces roridus TaxID=1738132 RepID=A0AAD7B867_9AGAR|nr:hypothetical protein FB45DRAFT_1036625 [Roridomyces roridus]